jgi:uncharacterized protein YbcI
MEAAGHTRTESPRGNISRRVVQLHKEFHGRGPTKAKTYVTEDLVVVLLEGGFTKVESTLLHGGRADSVAQLRQDFNDVMEARFREVVEEELGRKVQAFMSASHQEPDLLVEIYVLEPEVRQPPSDAQADDTSA